MRILPAGLWLAVLGLCTSALAQHTVTVPLRAPSGESGLPPSRELRFSVNTPQIDRLLGKPENLLAAEAVFTLAQTEATARFELRGTDGRLFGKISSPSGKEIRFPGLAKSLRDTPELVLSTQDVKNAIVLTGTSAPVLRLTIAGHTAHRLFTPPPPLKPGVFALIKDGHLSYDGQRLRLWGVVGSPRVDRLIKMGFNAQRVWDPNTQGTFESGMAYTSESAKKGEFAPYKKGDGSKMDLADRHLAELKAHGIFVMFAALTGTIPYEPLFAADSFIAGGDDWNEWVEAFRADRTLHYQYLFVDRRLQEIKKRHARNLLLHVNPYTGQAYGAEEAIATYEIFNENGFVYRVLNGSLKKWQPHFLAKLQARWNAWLVERYKNQEGLVAAWGELPAVESLAEGTVAPAPSHAERKRYPAARAADFIRFLTDLVDAFNQDFRSYCRSLFPEGVGVNVVPFSFDTLYRPSLQWAYGQSLGDVVSHGMYFFDLESSLSRPPAAYVMDSHTVEGRSNIIYETNAGRPGPYRAEFPFKVAALASLQDWDGIFWHYWGRLGGPDDLDYLSGTLQLPTKDHYWNAVHHELDPVMCSAMALAGQIFTKGMIAPPAKPDVYEVGSEALFSFSNFQGVNLASSTFTRGSRLRFVPDQKTGVRLDGAEAPPPSPIEKAVASETGIIWDWPNERLILDTSMVKAYVGKSIPSFRWSGGYALSSISSPWIAFGILSSDGQPLLASRRILLNGVADARNTGLDFDFSVRGGPLEQAAAVRSPGREPVSVEKVNYDLELPIITSGRLNSYDFALREVQSLSLLDVEMVSSQGETPFLNVLEITSRGALTPSAAKPATVIETAASPRGNLARQPEENPDPALPLVKGLRWGMVYADVLNVLRKSGLRFSSLNDEKSRGRIGLTGARLASLWSSTADVHLGFTDEKLSMVEVTFTQPPSLDEISTTYSAAYGKPSEYELAEQYGTTRVLWPATADTPRLLVTESQGTLKILMSPTR